MNKQEIKVGDRVVVDKRARPQNPVEFTGTVTGTTNTIGADGRLVPCMRNVLSDADKCTYSVDVTYCSKIITEPGRGWLPHIEHVDIADTPDQRAIRDRMAALTDLLLQKNRDYGSSFRQPGTLSAADPADKLIIRIEDKLSRFNTLYGARGPSVASESLVDTVNDLAGYFVLLGILIGENAP